MITYTLSIYFVLLRCFDCVTLTGMLLFVRCSNGLNPIKTWSLVNLIFLSRPGVDHLDHLHQTQRWDWSRAALNSINGFLDRRCVEGALDDQGSLSGSHRGTPSTFCSPHSKCLFLPSFGISALPSSFLSIEFFNIGSLWQLSCFIGLPLIYRLLFNP
jgi:hypothetical protein